jgi:hypothetical protein
VEPEYYPRADCPGVYHKEHHDGSYDFPSHLATVLVYFSDVIKGGDTAFINSRARVTPTKGAAVFWYNYYSSGVFDNATWHGGCPLILGEKWGHNEWVKYGLQHQLQCHLDPQTRYEILINGQPSTRKNVCRNNILCNTYL